jgi:hypothetical protein
MQISDDLVNGSGLCNRMNQVGSSGEPLVLEVIRNILSGGVRSPLSAMLEENHRSTCLAGCYRCLHRYGNQTYHGLLDWRLGLTVLQLLIDERHDAGLGGDFSTPGVNDWPTIARELADEAAGFLGGARKDIGHIPLIEAGEGRWVAVIHPFWNWDAVLDANPELQDFYEQSASMVHISTFELARRLGDVLHRLKTS